MDHILKEDWLILPKSSFGLIQFLAYERDNVVFIGYTFSIYIFFSCKASNSETIEFTL